MNTAQEVIIIDDDEPCNSSPSSKAVQSDEPTKSWNEEFTAKRQEQDRPAIAPKLRKREHIGDILDAPTNALIIHAVNCLGEWGSGIALHLRKSQIIPYIIYTGFCQYKASGRKSPLGECLLIDPDDDQVIDREATTDPSSMTWMACLFTSIGYGTKITTRNPGRGTKEEILHATASAVDHMLRQLSILYGEVATGSAARPRRYHPPLELWTCQFNSGNFKVPWEESEKILVEALKAWEHVGKVELVVVEPSKN